MGKSTRSCVLAVFVTLAAFFGPRAQGATEPASRAAYDIPQQNLQIPEDMAACSENARRIFAAIEKFRKDKGDMPEWLSDLVPDYLAEEALFCPNDSTHKSRYWPDPKLPCSYCYELNTAQLGGRPPLDGTMRHYKDLQRKLFGDVVPIVRCFHHGRNRVLNLAWDGRLYLSRINFEFVFIPNYNHQMVLESAEPAGPNTPAADKPHSYESDFAAFVKEINTTYPFFELKGIRSDWAAAARRLAERAASSTSDTEFLGIVVEAMRHLRDAHIGLRSAKAPLAKRPPSYYPGVSFMSATDGRVVLMQGREDLDPNLKIGTIVTKIDGRDARTVLEECAKAAWAEGGYFSSPQRARLFEFRIPLRTEAKGRKHTITIRVDGKSHDIKLSADVPAVGWPHWYNRPDKLTTVGNCCAYTKLPSGIGYIYLRRINRSTGPGMKEAFTTHGDAKAWIIDLRGNGGGGYDQALFEVLENLPRPLAVIIDAGCISAGETMARDLVRYGKARLFGSRTAGASSSKRAWAFPSKIATLSLPTRSRRGIGGKPIEFNGIAPDEQVLAVPQEVQKGLNSQIIRAETFLLAAVNEEPQIPQPSAQTSRF